MRHVDATTAMPRTAARQRGVRSRWLRHAALVVVMPMVGFADFRLSSRAHAHTTAPAASSPAPTTPHAPAAPAAPAAAMPPAAPDNSRSAYLVHLLGYVEWPAATFTHVDTPVVLGVANADALFAQLPRTAPARETQGRPLQVRRLAPGDPVEGLNALFVGGESEAQRTEWVRRVQGRPVLLVTEGRAGLASGAMLNLVTVQGRQRFEASIAAAEKAGLRLSSRLLAVAERVEAGDR